MEGIISEVLPNTIFKVTLENGHTVLGYLAGKMRRHEIRITMGDSVLLELTPYDLSRGRIIRRL